MILFLLFGFMVCFLIVAIEDWKTHHATNLYLAAMWLLFLCSMLTQDTNSVLAYLSVPMAFAVIWLCNEISVALRKKVFFGQGDVYVLPLWLSSVFFFTNFQFTPSLYLLLCLPQATYLAEFAVRRIEQGNKQKTVKIAMLPHLFLGTLVAFLI